MTDTCYNFTIILTSFRDYAYALFFPLPRLVSLTVESAALWEESVDSSSQGLSFEL